MASQFLIAPDGTVTHYTAAKAAKQAQESAPDSVLVASEADLANVKTPLLLAIYNAQNPDEQLTKFKNRAAGAAKVFEMLPQAAGLPARKPKGGAKGAASEDGPPKERKPRGDGYAGKTLTATEAGKGAKRRADTRRSQSFEVINSAKGSKMSYEQYVEKGGHPDDLAIMVRMNHVTVS